MANDRPARVVVIWVGPGEPIVLALYGPDGKVVVPLLRGNKQGHNVAQSDPRAETDHEAF